MFLAAPGRSGSAWALCCWLTLSLVAVCGPLVAVASLAAEHRFYGTQASVVAANRLSCMWDVACGILVPRPGIKPVSPALAGGFLTTRQPGTSPKSEFFEVTQSVVLC